MSAPTPYTPPVSPEPPAPALPDLSQPALSPPAFTAPEPPRGPGVRAPFPAPPVEGRGRRIGVGIGIGAGVLALIGGVGTIAVIGIGAVGTRALNEQIDTVVGDYFDALRDKRYGEAYEQMCADAKRGTTESQFTSDAREDPIASYSIGDFRITDRTVPVDVRYTDGTGGRVTAQLEQNTKTGGFEVCGIRE